jgi:hypothetical protein
MTEPNANNLDFPGNEKLCCPPPPNPAYSYATHFLVDANRNGFFVNPAANDDGAKRPQLQIGLVMGDVAGLRVAS